MASGSTQSRGTAAMSVVMYVVAPMSRLDGTKASADPVGYSRGQPGGGSGSTPAAARVIRGPRRRRASAPAPPERERAERDQDGERRDTRGSTGASGSATRRPEGEASAR